MSPDSADPNDLAALQRALHALPPPPAPRTLLPRVMAAAARLEEQRTRKNATTWFMWPRTLQAASVVALALLVAGAAWIWPNVRDLVGAPVSGALAAVWMHTISVAKSTVAVVSLTSIVWESFFQPIVRYLLVWIVLMSAACAAFGAALGRVALGGASHS
jgi:hypothetical protein